MSFQTRIPNSVMAVGYRGPASNQTIASGTNTTMQLSGTTAYDVGTGFSKASDIVTITNAGLYRLHAFAGFNTATGNCRNILRIETWTGADPGVGLATAIGMGDTFANVTTFNFLNADATELFAASQKVRCYLFQNQGTSNTGAGATFVNKLNILRL